jgi:hypothetical protein
MCAEQQQQQQVHAARGSVVREAEARHKESQSQQGVAVADEHAMDGRWVTHMVDACAAVHVGILTILMFAVTSPFMPGGTHTAMLAFAAAHDPMGDTHAVALNRN